MVIPPSRQQIAAMVGNDPGLIRAIEELFQTGGVENPATLEAVALVAAGAGAAASDAQGMADQARQSAALWPVPTGAAPLRFGQFYSTATQTAAAAGTAYAVTLNQTALGRGVEVVTGSEITVLAPGVYDFRITAQLDKTGGGTGHFYLWARRNGAIVLPGAAALHRVQGNNAEAVCVMNCLAEMAAGDHVEFLWATDNTSVILASHAAAGVVPAVPSVTVTVNNVEGPK